MPLVSKVQLYNQMMSSRSELDENFILQASEKIQKKSLLLDEVMVANKVGLYAPKKGDVLTDNIFKQLSLKRKELYYPLVAEDKLVSCRVVSLDELKPREDGLCMPCPGKRELRDYDDLDVIFVPGLAFSITGSRLGFGGGRWDRCLDNFRGKRIALAFDFQIIPELPIQLRKRKVDWIVTESRVILCRS